MSSCGLFVICFLLIASCAPFSSLAKHHDQASDFFQRCPPFTCGSGSSALQIRYPLRLRSADPSCGREGLDVTCSGNDTLLNLSPPLKIIQIHYDSSNMTVLKNSSVFGSSPTPCPLRNLSFLRPLETYLHWIPISLMSCSEKAKQSVDPSMMAGPISCPSSSSSSVYAVLGTAALDSIPSGCVVVESGGRVLCDSQEEEDEEHGNLGEFLELVEKRRDFQVNWWDEEQSPGCSQCEAEGGISGFDSYTQKVFCLRPDGHQGPPVKLITGTSVGTFLVLVTVTLIFLYITRLSVLEKEKRIRVEKFLAMYRNAKPTRYNYSSLKKMTKRFKHKLGEGGFGSVYKGELPNGIPVAVKMLETSRHEEQGFINEVATMGRIHHANIVSLLGFCSEGTRHALIYEYMPNKSLEKFIFSREPKRIAPSFSMEKLHDIAIGVARGIEYLHQGCDQRILHFDIKPHNILLDDNFNPKISDFGLAKLCSRDNSIITMTAARGTMGYIAPELYSRNFGTVSYKSDVYSFGMLLLEMVSGRRNADPSTENKSEVYLPEWAYDQLVQRGDQILIDEKGSEEDIVKKLLIVSLWCIQWNPTDRPTMTRTVQLLMGDLESMQIPPKPFISSE